MLYPKNNPHGICIYIFRGDISILIAVRSQAIASPKERPLEEYITFTVRGQSRVAKKLTSEDPRRWCASYPSSLANGKP